MKPNSVVPIVAGVIILFPLGFSLVWSAVSNGAEDARPFLEIPAEGECVEEATYMRFQHMDLLLELRDGVVRDGARGEIVRDGNARRLTLDGCWECHTNRETFCNQCHVAVNLDLNCFRCHYDPSTELPQTETAYLRSNRGEE